MREREREREGERGKERERVSERVSERERERERGREGGREGEIDEVITERCDSSLTYQRSPVVLPAVHRCVSLPVKHWQTWLLVHPVFRERVDAHEMLLGTTTAKCI